MMQEILDNAQIFNGVDESSQPDDIRQLRKRPAWKTDAINPFTIKPQGDLIITDVSQSHKLEIVKALSATHNDSLTSEEWLENHSLIYQSLTLKDLLERGRQVKTFGLNSQMVFNGMVISEFEYKLNEAIKTYHNRIKWLLEGTRRMFGLIKGDRVGIILDSSSTNTGFGRLQVFQKSLLALINEQLSTKRSLYFMKFGTNVESLWQVARDVNTRILEEARDFVQELKPSGSCNWLRAFKKILTVKRLNSIVFILGSRPDQSTNAAFDYIEQCLLGLDLPIHAIAYDTTNHKTHAVLQKIAKISKGRYHFFNSSEIRDSYKSSDVDLLLRESQRTLDVISKIKQMRSGMLGNALISIENEISLEVEHNSVARFLPRPVKHHQPLQINKSDFHPMDSTKWLKENGLLARQLNLYQVLAQDAFDPVMDFVPILKKSVTSRVNHNAMQQFQWHDGSVKNIHVDVTMLYDYQKKLGLAANIYEARIEWLASASRRIWGTICEKRIIFLIDTSISNKPYLVHLQHSLRLVIEQQLSNKEAFNMVAYGSQAKLWKPHMVAPTEENLQLAWTWVLHLEAGGSRNLFGAIRRAVENSDDIEKLGGVQGLYCITSGIPDQIEDVACSFINEVCLGSNLRLHTILFCVDDYQQQNELPARYADLTRTATYLRNLAHSGNGRFHWIRETGIIESDDITKILSEMENAVEYSQKCAMLVNAVTPKKDFGLKAIEPSRVRKVIMAAPLQHPRQTTLSIARQQQAIRGDSKKIIAWRAPNKKATLPPAPYQAQQRKKLIKNTETGSYKHFYTEGKVNVGMVFKKYPKKRSTRKTIPEPILPEKEGIMSSKQWLKQYGLSKVKLNLNRYVSGPLCLHDKSSVKSTGGQVHAKWFCSLFPSVEVNDKVRHIDMNIKEIDDYINKVTHVGKRYLQRMQWLLSGSKRTFGLVLETHVILLIDTSGSMDSHLPNLKSELKSLIWEQFRSCGIAFNILSYSDQVKSWQDATTDANDRSCEDATNWVSSLQAHGRTNILEALDRAFKDPTADAVYLLSDGKPDTSIKLTIESARRINRKRIPIHTISFNSNDNSHAAFLATLAHQSGGRYHVCKGNRDANLTVYKMMSEGLEDENDPSLPDFQGDDLKHLRAEITKVRKYITQAWLYKKIIQKHQEEVHHCTYPHPNYGVKVVGKQPFLP